MQINLIAAMAKNRVIGKDNKLPRDYPEDLAYFRKQTNGGIVIMGKNTYLSIGRPLPKRRNIVLSRNNETIEGVEIFNNIPNLIKKLQETTKSEEKIRIIGGQNIYKQFLEQDLVDYIYLTEIKKDYEGDTYFPEFENKFKEISRDEGKNMDFVIHKKS